ncbi:MAG: enolase C-terminal domain-like protein [Bacteriovorax sp.]|nr:enolase C-terminal domain-like protein [Bacteriovorax sp.]
MFNWSIKEIELPLKFTWNISRNSSDIKHNFIVELRNGSLKSHGEVAFNVRYGETREIILEKFDEFKASAPQDFNGVESLVAYLESLDLPQSLKFGIESSFVHYLSILSGKSVALLMGTNVVSSVKTSFSIPIMDIGKVEAFINDNNLKRFSALKVKVNRENAHDFCQEILKHTNVPLRVDANESFLNATETIKFLENFSNLKRLEFLEQPMHSSMHDEALELKKHSSVLLMADESVINGEINEYFVERFHGINVKMMKAGGYMKAIKQLRQAKILGLKTMLGCMVETSLGISSALNVSGGVDYFDLDGSLLLKEEPYKLISEENGKIFYSYIQ